MLVPGAIPSEIYKTITENLPKGFEQNFMGFGKRSVKFLGHGIGLTVDETPVIAKGFDDRITSYNVCYTKLLRIHWVLLSTKVFSSYFFGICVFEIFRDITKKVAQTIVFGKIYILFHANFLWLNRILCFLHRKY